MMYIVNCPMYRSGLVHRARPKSHPLLLLLLLVQLLRLAATWCIPLAQSWPAGGGASDHVLYGRGKGATLRCLEKKATRESALH